MTDIKPGDRVRTQHTLPLEGGPDGPSAVISDDGRYRYRLDRPGLGPPSRLTVVMLNPSTADGTQDDPTIRRLLGFCRDLRYGHLTVVNLYAWRATKPADLPSDAAARIGPLNDQHIAAAVDEAGHRFTDEQLDQYPMVVLPAGGALVLHTADLGAPMILVVAADHPRASG